MKRHAPLIVLRATRPLSLMAVLSSTLATAQISQVLYGGGSFMQYDLFEADVNLTTSMTDHYAPGELSVVAHFAAPDGRLIDVRGFWYEGQVITTSTEPLDPSWTVPPCPANLPAEAIGPTGGGVWKIRFTPDMAGLWSFSVDQMEMGVVVDTEPSLGSYDLNVLPSTLPGFIVRANKRYLKRTSGEFFFPVGENIVEYGVDLGEAYCEGWGAANQPNGDDGDPGNDWCSDEQDGVLTHGVGQFQDWLDKLSDGGGNTVRIWIDNHEAMSLLGFDIKDYTLHDCDDLNQKSAYQFDQIVEYARSKGVSLIITFFRSDYYKGVINDGWEYWNPFNRFSQRFNAPGLRDCQCIGSGSIFDPTDFLDVSNACIFQHTKDLASYIVARWGYATNILAWEFWNEFQFIATNNEPYSSSYVGGTPIPVDFYDNAAEWHTALADHVRSVDPYDHLITTSYGDCDASPPFWCDRNITGFSDLAFENLDFVTSHEYPYASYPGMVDRHDFPLYSHERTQHWTSQYAPGTKPYLMGEWWHWPVIPGTDDLLPCKTGYDPHGFELHQTMWATSFSGAMGAALNWEWGAVNNTDCLQGDIDCQSLYHLYGPVASFMNSLPVLTEDLEPRQPMYDAAFYDQMLTEGVYMNDCGIVSSPGAGNGFRVFLLKQTNNELLLGYAQDLNFAYDNLLCAGHNSQYLTDPNSLTIPGQAGVVNTISIPVTEPDGREFLVRWISTTNADADFDDPSTWFSSQTVTAAAGTITINMPQSLRRSFYGDAVFAITMVCDEKVWRRGQLLVPAPANVAGDLACSPWGGQVFFRTLDNRLHSYWFDEAGEQWLYSNLDDLAGTNVSGSLLVSNDGTKVFYRTVDGNVRGLWWNAVPAPGHWEYAPLDDASAGLSVTRPMALGPNDEIYFRTAAGELKAIHWNTGTSSWEPYGAVNALGVNNASVGGMCVGANGQVFYTTTAGGISSIDPTGGWHIDGLGGGLLAGTSSITGPIVRGANGQIVFRRANGKIYRAWKLPGGTWQSSGAISTQVSPHISSDAAGSIFFKRNSPRLEAMLWNGSSYVADDLDFSAQTGVAGSLALDNLGSAFFRTSGNKVERVYLRSECFETPSPNFRHQPIEEETHGGAGIGGLSAFPNPTSGRLKVRLPTAMSHGEVRVLSLMGQLLMTHKVTYEHLELDLTHLAGGTYLLEYRASDGAITQERIVVQP